MNMADAEVLTIEKREGRGTRAAVKVRKSGRIPAVVYGHKEETVSVSLSGDELQSVLRHKAKIVDLKFEGAVQKAQIREVQWDHLGKEVLHVDLKRVSVDERIEISVPVELRGIAPGVTSGGVLDQPIHSLRIECLAVAVPESIRVNILTLQLGASIHVRDLQLPTDVKALDDPDAVVVHVTTPQAEPEAGAAPLGEQAEPEIIGRKAAEEEAEAE
jgi:large subunit ribosomal protein L25